jgi:hypothetical protein
MQFFKQSSKPRIGTEWVKLGIERQIRDVALPLGERSFQGSEGLVLSRSAARTTPIE